MGKFPFRAAAVTTLTGVALLGMAVATVVLLRPSNVPEELRAATDVASTPVGQEEFVDERTVKVALRRSQPPPLTMGMAGRVTENRCRAGKALKSGAVAARINDKPVIALATSVPLYRTLREKDKGADVSSLQRELIRLGYSAVETGTFGSRTAEAVEQLQHAAGIEKPDGVVTIEHVIWLPAHSVVPESCELARGGYAVPNQVYAKLSARLTGIVIGAMPAGAVAGKRTITMLGVTGPLNADGTATDAKFLAKVASSPQYRAVTATDKGEELTASVALKQPLRTLKLPPGALFDIRGDKACVQSGTAVYPVRIISSRLGATLVVPDGKAQGNPLKQVNIGSSITEESCS